MGRHEHAGSASVLAPCDLETLKAKAFRNPFIHKGSRATRKATLNLLETWVAQSSLRTRRSSWTGRWVRATRQAYRGASGMLVR